MILGCRYFYVVFVYFFLSIWKESTQVVNIPTQIFTVFEETCNHVDMLPCTQHNILLLWGETTSEFQLINRQIDIGDKGWKLFFKHFEIAVERNLYELFASPLLFSEPATNIIEERKTQEIAAEAIVALEAYFCQVSKFNSNTQIVFLFLHKLAIWLPVSHSNCELVAHALVLAPQFCLAKCFYAPENSLQPFCQLLW